MTHNFEGYARDCQRKKTKSALSGYSGFRGTSSASTGAAVGAEARAVDSAGTESSQRFRPLSFAEYSARSARRSSNCGSPFRALLLTAAPKLAVTRTSPACVTIGLDSSEARILSASAIVPAASVADAMIRNSSPPYRPTVSYGRMHSFIRRVRLQHFVPAEMPVGVVHILEVIDVHKNDSEGAMFARLPR